MKKLMQSKKMLISSIVSLCLSIFMLGTASFAWLSMNKETNSNGVQLKVEVTPNLIIDDDSNQLQAVTNPTETNFSHTFSDEAVAKKPATHDWTVGTTTGLKYVNNPHNVSTSSGLAKTGTLTFAPVTTTDYYVDFTVYIASTGAAMAGMDLTATFAPAATIAGSGANRQDTLDATSIDFYVGSVSSGTFMGTLNVKGYDATANNHSTTKTSVKLVNNDSIPLNTDSYITVIMRCYFDGALLKGENQAFINTAKVDTSDVTLNVTFTATEHS